MLDIAEIAGGRVSATVRQRLLDRLLVALEDKRRVVAELPEVLQRLEDVLLLPVLLLVRPDDVVDLHLRARLREVVVQELLQLRQLTVVVLNNLRGKIVEDVFLEPPEKEGKDLFVQGLQCERS